MRSILPILTVVAAIVVLWYAAAIPMNTQWARDQAARADTTISGLDLVADTWSQERPRLPVPHQVVAELWGSTGELALQGRALSKRSLLLHTWYTFSATMLGFFIGTAAGVLLAVGIIYNRAMDMAVMPWAIASPDHPDPRHRADDHRGAEFHRHSGADSEGDHLGLSVVFPGGRGHGEGPARAGARPARSAVDLFGQRVRPVLEAADCPPRCPISSPR